MQQMKERAEKDLNQHSAEIKELQRVIDHDRRLKEFMGTKTQERSISEEVLDARRRRGDYESNPFIAHGPACSLLHSLQSVGCQGPGVCCFSTEVHYPSNGLHSEDFQLQPRFIALTAHAHSHLKPCPQHISPTAEPNHSDPHE